MLKKNGEVNVYWAYYFSNNLSFYFLNYFNVNLSVRFYNSLKKILLMYCYANTTIVLRNNKLVLPNFRIVVYLHIVIS